MKSSLLLLLVFICSCSNLSAKNDKTRDPSGFWSCKSDAESDAIKLMYYKKGKMGQVKLFHYDEADNKALVNFTNLSDYCVTIEYFNNCEVKSWDVENDICR